MIHKSSWLLCVCLTLISYCSFAQQADFNVNNNAGCSGLVVTFTNTSTGFSPSADYEFNYGEGGGSIPFPASPHTYINEQTFSATLTVTDGGQTYTQTKQIIIYKKPVVDFTADIPKSCANNVITYTSSSTAGDGTIAKYGWDFGDGNTLDTTSAIVKHAYSAAHNITARCNRN